MSLTRVIGRLNTGSYTVTRTPYTVVDGMAVNGTPTTFTISASIQHPTERQLRDLAEGQSTEEVFAVYSTTELYLRRSDFAPDIITINSSQYRVIKATHYTVLSDFWVAFCERLDVP